MIAFRHTASRFCAYANGKSFGVLSSKLRAYGPHHFQAMEYNRYPALAISALAISALAISEGRPGPA